MQHTSLSNIFRPFVKEAYITDTPSKTGLFTKFNAWLEEEEENRLLWLGIAVLGGIGTVLPLTLLAVVFFANNSFTLWALVCAINVPILIVNLAAQPPKITLPILFSAWFVDAVIILYSLSVFFTTV